ncbi:peptidylprolyl isomerase [Sphingobacterium sp. SRCM116780]|uniref:peptidylprolyl isomerase n=1 Tax=Sphingobacterium sp. SRCM116780 TaxID=2907623 RepID=UPI001F1CCB0B|nr:peptidylprolyl isomerase [Sphingobacterium sp. SRCM116780]UIR56120.1 peptidylprolyl isomerase [Sphingobacterium sp. SRCM116780]
MKKIILFSLFCVISLVVFAAKPTNKYVRIQTDKGVIVLKLYNETPKHRDNFVKLVKENYFDSLLFHRVIHNFMIQSGDPDSRNAKPGQLLGDGGPNYTIPSEIQTGLFHKKGALGAARDDNPAKASSASQFYIVQGKKFSDGGLDSLETLRMKGVKFTEAQRTAYKTVGGSPHLDGNYTVFGELISGIEVVDEIAAVKTDKNDRPVVDEHMSIKLLTKREAVNLERELKGLKPKNGLFTKISDLFSSKDY